MAYEGNKICVFWSTPDIIFGQSASFIYLSSSSNILTHIAADAGADDSFT